MAVDGIRAWVEAFRGGGERRDRVRAIDDLFYRRSLYDTPAAFFEALVELFPRGDTLDPASLEAIARGLRAEAVGGWVGDEPGAYLTFWADLAARTGSSYARGCQADALLAAGEKKPALELFLQVFTEEPQLLSELGGDVESLAKAEGGDAFFRYRLVELRAAIASGDEEVRERYSELLEDVSGDPRAAEEVRQIGREIDAAVERGDLPRAMVRRGPTRPQR